ncbi:MAG: aminoglycoside phosphotransferase family protein [Terriglobia bacterium]
MAWKIPDRLRASCRQTPQAAAWLEQLPETLGSLERQWSLTVGAPIDTREVSCAWVAPVTRADGSDAVLKLGMPHMEGEHEIQGLRFWDGEPTVRLLEADDSLGAMLIERCQPGTGLRASPEPEQDLVIAGLLRRLWRLPPAPHPFRPLSMMLKYWSEATLRDRTQWSDPGLVREGLALFEELPRTTPTEVLLATDLHAGNVLESERMPWLVIDPKPFVGDPAYDATQHLFNCEERLRSDPRGLISRMAGLLAVDAERIRLWTFARAAAEPRQDWSDARSLAIARATAP